MGLHSDLHYYYITDGCKSQYPIPSLILNILHQIWNGHIHSIGIMLIGSSWQTAALQSYFRVRVKGV
jgi:hypothetical protein